MVPAPNFSTTGAAPSDNTQWLKVEFHYAVAPVKGDFLDEVQFKVWVEGRDLQDPQGKPHVGIAVGFTGQVTYVNVPKTKDAYGVFFIHPNTLARYCTEEGVEDFTRKFDVHIEAYVGGAKMDYYDKNKEADLNWFQQLKPIPDLVYRQNQSPFIMSDIDRYPGIKLMPSPAQ